MRGKNYIVYKHTSPSNKVYIGITSMKPNERWNNGEGYSRQAHFYSAIQKYGWDNFKHEILCEGLSKEDAINKEIELIAYYNSNNRKYGYNQTTGGEHFKHSEETKRMLSELHKGKPLSEEHKRSISNSEKGKKLSDETKELIRLNHAKYWTGRSGSKHITSKKVLCIETNIIYGSTREVQRECGIHYSCVSRCCNGEQTTAKGLHWKYVA